jgi:hypothetical protein
MSCLCASRVWWEPVLQLMQLLQQALQDSESDASRQEVTRMNIQQFSQLAARCVLLLESDSMVLRLCHRGLVSLVHGLAIVIMACQLQALNCPAVISSRHRADHRTDRI